MIRLQQRDKVTTRHTNCTRGKRVEEVLPVLETLEYSLHVLLKDNDFIIQYRTTAVLFRHHELAQFAVQRSTVLRSSIIQSILS